MTSTEFGSGGNAMLSFVSLGVFLALVFLAATTGAFFQPGQWYAGLNKPTWTPPNWLFPVAWTVLYTMIAVAGWKVWQAEGLRAALFVWGIALAFNMAWSWIMFGRQEIGLALIDLILLWVAIVAFMVLAWPVSRTAVYLFVPYFFWVSFAGALNFAVWRLNP
jgi:benzodiazapine receptor